MLGKRNTNLTATKTLLSFGLCILIVILGASGCSTPSPEDIAKQADSYLAANKPGEATRLLQTAISESPESSLLKRKLAEVYFRSGRYSDLFSYLESGSLETHSSAGFYYLLSTVEQKEENWIGVLTHAKRGLGHAQATCSGFFFLLNWMTLEAQLKLEDAAEAKIILERIVDSWNQLSCEDHRGMAEAGGDIGEAFDFESLSASERQEFQVFESLSKLANMYRINSGIVTGARQKLDQFQRIHSNFEERVASCKADARARYERQWASACRNEAENTTRSIRVCFHNRLPLARLDYQNDSLAEASAMDYCEAVHGSIDDSESCALPREVANRLNARMETAVRKCDQIMDIFE